MSYKSLKFTDFERRYFNALFAGALIANGVESGRFYPLVLGLIPLAAPFLYDVFATVPMPEPIRFRMPKCLEKKLD